jgi:putative Holliday junction resolvase
MNIKKLPPGRLAGVDYGRRRIGISICDSERMIASPLLVHKTTGDREFDALFFLKLVEQEDIVGFVVGLPIHSDGRNSEMSSEVEKFATWLSDITERPVVFQDERHTSQEASGLLRPARLTRSRKKERHDAVAAQVILSAWLERHVMPQNNSYTTETETLDD